MVFPPCVENSSTAFRLREKMIGTVGPRWHGKVTGLSIVRERRVCDAGVNQAANEFIQRELRFH
jgi:hypothetical protein